MWEDHSLGSRKLDHAKRCYLTLSKQRRQEKPRPTALSRAVWTQNSRRKDCKTKNNQPNKKTTNKKPYQNSDGSLKLLHRGKQGSKGGLGDRTQASPSLLVRVGRESGSVLLAVWDYSLHKHVHFRRAQWAEGKLPFLKISVQWRVAFITGSFVHKLFAFHRKSQKKQRA